MELIRVVVVDDQPLLVSAFTALVGNQPDMEVVGSAGNGDEAVEVVTSTATDVVLMDIRMPVLDGIGATERLAAADTPGPSKVLVLTTFNIDELVLGAVAAGARGFLLKDAEPAAMLDAIRAVHRGEAVVDPASAPYLLEALQQRAAADTGTDGIAARLTRRELDVLTLIARGLTNSEIATELFIAETTVKTHVGNLLLKLDARDRVALVVLAHSAALT